MPQAPIHELNADLFPRFKDASQLPFAKHHFAEYHDATSLIQAYNTLDTPQKPPLPDVDVDEHSDLMAQWLQFHNIAAKAEQLKADLHLIISRQEHEIRCLQELNQHSFLD